ncbi:MAG: AAA family ATPase [Candidatus Asgardarchaeia archaeon]
MVKVIGLLGPIGSGKTTVATYLRDKYGFFMVVMGDLVREIVRKRGLIPTRKILQDVQKEYVSKFGGEYFAQLVIKKIDESGAERAVIDGMRRKEDVLVPKQHYGDNILILLIDAPPKLRFERLLKRKREDRPKTYEDFLTQERREYEIFNLDDVFKLADEVIINDSGFSILYERVDKILKKYDFI